jgi:hypothetical protein
MYKNSIKTVICKMLDPNHIILNGHRDGPSLTQVAEHGKPHTGFGKSQAVVLLDNPKVSCIMHKERDLACLNGKLRRKFELGDNLPPASVASSNLSLTENNI